MLDGRLNTPPPVAHRVWSDDPANFSTQGSPASITTFTSTPCSRWRRRALLHARPDGELIGKIRLPEVVANVCFGGPKLNRLFICATTSL